MKKSAQRKLLAIVLQDRIFVILFLLFCLTSTHHVIASCPTPNVALLRVTNLTKNKVKLSIISSGYTEYHWRYKKSNATSFNNVTTTEPEVTIDVRPTTRYEFQLQLKCPDGTTSPFSISKLFTSDCETVSGPIEYLHLNDIDWSINLNSSGYYGAYESYHGKFVDRHALGIFPLNRDWGSNSPDFTWPIGGGDVIENVQFRMECPDGTFSPWSSDYTLRSDCRAPRLNEIGADPGGPNTLRLHCDKYASAYQFRLREQGTAAWRNIPQSTLPFVFVDNINPNKNYEVECRLLCSNQYTDYSPTLTYLGISACTDPIRGDYWVSHITSTSAKVEDRGYDPDVVRRWEFRWKLGSAWITQRSDQPFLVIRDLYPDTDIEWGFRRTCNNSETSNWSPEMVYFRTESICLGPINSLHVLNVDYNTARFNTSEDVYAMYQYRYRIQGRSKWTTTEESNQHLHRIEGLQEGESYEWQGRGKCESKWSEWVDGPVFTTVSCNPPDENSIGAENITSRAAELQYREYIPNKIQWRYKKDNSNNWIELNPIREAIQYLEGLDDGSIYKYGSRLSCVDADGNERWSAWSPTFVFETYCQGSILRINQITSTSMKVTAVKGYTEYQFSYQLQGNINWTTLATTPNNTIDLVDLLPGTTYDIIVRITCNGSQGPWSAPSSETTLVASFNATAPPHPTYLTAMPIDEQMVHLECQLGDVPAYQYRVRRVGTTSWDELSETPNSIDTVNVSWDESCDDDSVECNLYEFQCRLYLPDSLRSGFSRSIKWSAWSVSVYFNPMKPHLSSCSTPSLSEIIALSVDDASAVLYCDIPNALKYEFRYRIKNTQPWTFTPITDKPGVGLKGLYADTSYEFQCRIACQAAVSPWSRSKNFRTRSSTDCSPPLFNNLFVREIKTKDARLNCAINGVLGFDWRYREPDSLTWLPLPASRENFYYVDQLKPATKYVFQSRVGCLDSTLSPWSLSIPFQTLQDCPSVTAQSLLLTRVDANSVRCAYINPAQARYIIRLRTVGAEDWTTLGPTRDSSILISTLENKPYEFQVMNLCSQTSSSWSSSILFDLNTVTASKSMAHPELWALYPNPMTDHLCVDLTAYPGQVSFRILNALGHSMYQSKVAGGRLINLSVKLAPGIYYCNLETTGSRSSIKKLIVL